MKGFKIYNESSAYAIVDNNGSYVLVRVIKNYKDEDEAFKDLMDILNYKKTEDEIKE
jgi:hypothetical protein